MNEKLYNNWGSTSCDSVPDGNYWFQPDNTNPLVYFNNTSPINIVTLVNGYITDINTCYYPAPTTTTTTTPTPTTTTTTTLPPVVAICSQEWTIRNLEVTTYSDGITQIPQATNISEWNNYATNNIGAWCYYGFNAANGTTYGKLYNWYAVAGIYNTASLNTPSLRKQIAPTGYHVPTDAEFTILTDCLLGELVAGGKMKSTGTIQAGTGLWNDPNTAATNSSGFTGLPGGWCDSFGTFSTLGDVTYWWSSSESSITSDAWNRFLNHNSASVTRSTGTKGNGYSVRLIKDPVILPVITICNQEWTTENLDVATYSDGTAIPQATTDADWIAKGNAGIGAWCWYANLSANGTTYGKLYNWFAVAGIDGTGIPRSLAPAGYHIPTDAEWTTLTNTCLLGEAVAGAKMKETGTAHWPSPNTEATNSSGFTALPGGVRSTNGTFSTLGYFGNWWSSSQYLTANAWIRALNSSSDNAFRSNGPKSYGCSVRLIKD